MLIFVTSNPNLLIPVFQVCVPDYCLISHLPSPDKSLLQPQCSFSVRSFTGISVHVRPDPDPARLLLQVEGVVDPARPPAAVARGPSINDILT